MALRRTPDSRPLEPTADDPELEDVSATVKLTLRPPFMQVAGAEAASISDLMDTHITQILGQPLSPARARYDSVLGDREMVRGTFKEFVVYDADNVYPAYEIRYRRVL